MSSKHRLTRSFRTLSALLYLLNIITSLKFAIHRDYLRIVVGLLVSLLCTVMLCVSIESPVPIISKLESSKFGEALFTFRGRYMIDLLLALLLFAMGMWGIFMGLFTLLLIFGIRFLGVKQPDAFNEIFRQYDMETQSQADSYTLEGTYDTEGSAIEK